MTDWNICEPKSSGGCRFKGKEARMYRMNYAPENAKLKVCGNIMNEDRFCKEEYCPIKVK